MSGTPTAPAAILFDLDGTLIDTHRLYLEAYRLAIREFTGTAPTDEEIVLRKPTAERRFLSDWVGPADAAACHAAMCGHYRDLHAAYFDGTYDGVREMLAGLRSAGLPLGIVTGKGRSAWETTSSLVDLGEFVTVITEDEMTEPKPDPGGLLAAAAAMGSPAFETVYIGDSLADIEGARRAGMLAGAVLWPKTDPDDRESFLEAVKEHRPDWLFERPADLVRAFAAWC